MTRVSLNNIPIATDSCFRNNKVYGLWKRGSTRRVIYNISHITRAQDLFKFLVTEHQHVENWHLTVTVGRSGSTVCRLSQHLRVSRSIIRALSSGDLIPLGAGDIWRSTRARLWTSPGWTFQKSPDSIFSSQNILIQTAASESPITCKNPCVFI